MGAVIVGPGGTVDVSDRPARQVGHVTVDGVTGTVPVTGPLTDAQLRAAPVQVTGATSNGLTDAQLRAIPVPVSGVVATSGITDAQLRAAPPAVRDDYQTGDVLADQSGAGGVLTFTFPAPVQLAVVHATGAGLTARADPFGGAPSASTGVKCPDDVPTYIPVVTSTIKVYAPSGMTVGVWGYRRSADGQSTPVPSMFQETSTPLAGGAAVNGATRTAGSFSLFRAFASSDQSGTLSIQQSRNGTTWYETPTSVAVTGGATGTVLESLIAMPYVRARYVNGASAQTTFEFDSALMLPAGLPVPSPAMLPEPSTPLAGGAAVNGAPRPAAGYSLFRAFAASSHTGTLSVQQSRDGTAWYETISAAVAGGAAGQILESIIAMPYVRARYVNGATAQTTFELDSALVGI